MRFQPSLTGTLNLGRTNAFFLGGGKALVNAYYLTAEKLGVEILYDTEVVSLNMDDGAVRSIDITYKGFPETIHARCVVASSGGFQANLEWMREYWGDAVDNFVIRGTPYNRGAGTEEFARSGRWGGRRPDPVPRRGTGCKSTKVRWRDHNTSRQRALQRGGQPQWRTLLR